MVRRTMFPMLSPMFREEVVNCWSNGLGRFWREGKPTSVRPTVAGLYLTRIRPVVLVMLPGTGRTGSAPDREAARQTRT